MRFLKGLPYTKPTILVATGMMMSACASILPAPGSEKLLVKSAEEVIHCQFLGWSTGHTQDKISVFPRSAERVQKEILILARNEALEMETNVPPNALVIETNVAAGSRTFGVYHCPE
jgi:hypothetical protein